MSPIEKEMQRFVQVRNEIQEEINKIGPCVSSLQETGKLLVSHFDVFRQISKNTQEQMPVIIQTASQTMAKTISDETSQLIKSTLEEKILVLDESVQNASQILNESMSSKHRKAIAVVALVLFLTGLMSFMGGYFYARKNTYALPTDFIKMYALELSVQETPPSSHTFLKKQEKRKSKQKSNNH